MNFCRLPQKFSNLLVFNSLLQILIFSDLYDFFGLALWSPLPREGTKTIVYGPAFGASLFKLWGLVCFYLGASLLGALDSLGPRAVWILL
jgi:hypothetical protein